MRTIERRSLTWRELFLVGVLVAAFFASPFLAAAPPTPIKFKTSQLTMGGVQIKVELAITDAEQQRGLMFRREIKDDAGMLFVYEDEAKRGFWMKNTFIPLSIGFFDRHKKLIEVIDMTPVTSEMQVVIPTYESSKPAMYALEVAQGWFTRKKLKPGVTFKLTP